MTKSNAPLAATLASTTSGFVAHTFVRLRGPQVGTIAVSNARTPEARVTLGLGSALLVFWTAAAAQGVLAGISAAKGTLMNLPNAVPETPDPYGQCTIAVDWTSCPTYAVVPQARPARHPDRPVVRWTDVHMGPLTWQLLDRSAFHGLTELLHDVHRTTVAVCLDGAQHRADPTRPGYLASAG